MASVNQDDKLIAHKVAEIFGTKPSVSRYWDDNHKSYVDILVCSNSPWSLVNSYSTVTLSNFRVGIVDDMQLGVEFVAACEKSFLEMPNIVATCAFNIINSGYICNPGTVFPDIVGMYNPQLTMKHILFVTPFLWDKKFITLNLTSKKVAWLMLVPISEAEFNYIKQESASALEKIFESQQINVFDMNRKSVVA